MSKTRRSNKALSRQRRFVNHLVSKKAHVDHEKSESINILTTKLLWDALWTKFRQVHPLAYEHVDRGEVTSDGRGEGTLQQVTA